MKIELALDDLFGGDFEISGTTHDFKWQINFDNVELLAELKKLALEESRSNPQVLIRLDDNTTINLEDTSK